MKALVYHGSKDVRIDSVPDPQLKAADDIVLRITATAICGSDLHLYRGKVPMLKEGDILGHEFMGIVEETGKTVTKIRRGDRVVVPFVIACGDCFFCRSQLFSACETTNHGTGGTLNAKGIKPSAALFGYTHMYGGVPGGQAEYVRVPKANVGPLAIPDGMADEQVLFLSDILPTVYQAILNGEVKEGSKVIIYGAGPVGLLSAACARLKGAETIFSVDNQPYRLKFAAEKYGVIPLNFDQCDPAAEIMRKTKGRGADCAIDAVGFEAKGSKLESVLASLKLEGGSGEVLRQCIAAVRRGGVVSVPGVYAGPLHNFGFGDAFDKGLTFRMGQTHVQKFLPELLEYIAKGELNPDEIITHRLPLTEAVHGYEIFEKMEENCRKVVLLPGLTSKEQDAHSGSAANLSTKNYKSIRITKDDLHQVFLAELSDIYDAEKQLTVALPKLAKAAQSPGLRQAFQSHLKETKGHVSRLEKIARSLGEKLKRKPCKAMKGLIAEGSELIKEYKSTTVLDSGLIGAAQKVEHYEIASYRTLCAWAKLLDHQNTLTALNLTLNEEKAADKKLTVLGGKASSSQKRH